MNTSLKWIKALVPGLDCGVQEYVDAMTLSGSKVEGYEQLDARASSDRLQRLKNTRMPTNLSSAR